MRVRCDEVETSELLALGDGGDGLALSAACANSGNGHSREPWRRWDAAGGPGGQLVVMAVVHQPRRCSADAL